MRRIGGTFVGTFVTEFAYMMCPSTGLFIGMEAVADSLNPAFNGL